MPGRSRKTLARRHNIVLVAVMAAAIPLIAAHPGELSGAAAPIGWAMLGGAFVFGVAMQVVLGCASPPRQKAISIAPPISPKLVSEVTSVRTLAPIRPALPGAAQKAEADGSTPIATAALAAHRPSP